MSHYTSKNYQEKNLKSAEPQSRDNLQQKNMFISELKSVVNGISQKSEDNNNNNSEMYKIFVQVAEHFSIEDYNFDQKLILKGEIPPP